MGINPLLNRIIGVLAILSGLILIIFLLIVLSWIPHLVDLAISGVIAAIIVMLFDFGILGYYIKTKKLKVGGKFFMLSIIPPIIADLMFLALAGISIVDFKFSINAPGFLSFGVVLIITLICWLAGSFISIGTQHLENMKNNLPFHKRKTPLLGLVAIVFIIAAPVGGYFLQPSLDLGYVNEKYEWNTGPWLTWNGNVSNTMTISWLTAEKTASKLNLGTSPSNLSLEFSDPKLVKLHRIELTGLIAATTYYYSINGVTFENQVAGTINNFTTGPVSNADFKFVVVGDMQPTNERTQVGGKMVADGIAAVSPAFVLSLGDRASSGGEITYWHNVMRNIAVYGCTSPIMGCIGNHDYGGDASFNFRHIFPYNYASGYSNHYSFDYGNVHVVNLDSPIVGAAQEEQRIWAEQDIIAAKARGQKWIFITLHYTIMSTGTSNSNFDFQKWLVPLADKYDVDGVFFGHDHHYEHWNMTYGSSGFLYNSADTPSGNETHFWMSGGGGSNLEVDYGVMGSETTTGTSHFTETMSVWNKTTQAMQDIVIERSYWNRSLYVDNSTNRIYAQNATKDYLYYHVPSIQSYSTANSLLGYQYGEQTMHYMMIEITNNGNTCTVSTRYPNGNLLMGPNNAYPQLWSFNK